MSVSGQCFMQCALLCGLSSTAGLLRAQDAAFKTAYDLYTAGRLDDAKVILARATRGPGASALDWSLLGGIFLLQGDLGNAEADTRRALTLSPGLVGARFTLGSILEAEDKKGEAGAALRAVVAVDPNHEGALLALGRLETAEGHWGMAQGYLERAMAHRSSDDVQPFLAMARLRNLQGNTEGALASCLQAKRIAPHDPKTLYAVGVLCLQMDLLKDAKANLEAAAAAEPSTTNLYALASALVAQRNLDGAIDIYKRLLETDRSNAQLNYALGAAYYLANNNEEARSAFERSLAAQPDQVESRYYLGLLADREGKANEAISLLEDVLKRQPDHARAHLALGLAYRAAGDLNAAVRELQTAVHLQPDNGKAHYQLGLVLAALKQEEGAKQELAAAGRLRQTSSDKVSWELKPDGPSEEHAR